MKNFIEYFYNLKIDNIIMKDKFYIFYSNDALYKLYIYENYGDIDLLYNVNRQMINNTLVSEIIVNRNNQIISTYNGVKYILIKIYVNINNDISLNEIVLLSRSANTSNLNINWGSLWEKKIDYLENLISENGKKYPLIVDSFNYFVGLAENAISYYNMIEVNSEYQYVISHREIKFNDTLEDLYNPLNIIFDYRVRDIAEYIKRSFFVNNKLIWEELKLFFKKNSLTVFEAKLLISRLLYPSFYFEMYNDILLDNVEEKILIDVIARIDDYEIYLGNVISFISYHYNVEEIEWLKKNHTNIWFILHLQL